MGNEYQNFLKHYGIQGMKWGVRRFQNPDGTLTPEGRERYTSLKTNAKDLNEKINRYCESLEQQYPGGKFKKVPIDNRLMPPSVSSMQILDLSRNNPSRLEKIEREWLEKRTEALKQVDNYIKTKLGHDTKNSDNRGIVVFGLTTTLGGSKDHPAEFADIEYKIENGNVVYGDGSPSEYGQQWLYNIHNVNDIRVMRIDNL